MRHQYYYHHHQAMWTVHCPLFFPKTVEIENFTLRAAILDECQIYLGVGERFERRREK